MAASNIFVSGTSAGIELHITFERNSCSLLLSVLVTFSSLGSSRGMYDVWFLVSLLAIT